MSLRAKNSTTTYNRLGKTSTIADVTGTRTFTYNLSGTLEQQNEILPSAYFGDRRITRGYDTSTSGALGRYNRLSVGPAATPYGEHDQAYGFDASGRLNSTLGSYTYTYAANSHLLASIAHTSSGWTQTRTYLPNANALDIIETKVSTTSKAKFDHTHDALYRATTILKTGEQFSTYGNGTQGIETDHAYNDRGEVTADSTALGGTSTPLTGRDDYFTYDPIGNRTSVNRSGSTITYTPNLLNQYSAITGSANPTYDDDGNLTSDGVWNYTWDAENRLIAQETASGVTPKKKLEFKYDYRHRRVRKTYYTWGGAAWITSADLKFVYDGSNALLELNAASSNAKVSAHIWGLDLSGSLRGAGGVGGLLYTYDYATSTAMLPAYDGNGNITNYVNSATGALIAKFEFDAFGRTISESGTHAAAAKFRFATKYADTESGLIYYNRRYYDPASGRFRGRDPIAEQGGLNLYAYVLNNPVGRYDYLGMDPIDNIRERIRDGLPLPPSIEGPEGSIATITVRGRRVDVDVTDANGRTQGYEITVHDPRADVENTIHVLNMMNPQVALDTGRKNEDGGGAAPEASNDSNRWSDEKCAGLASQIATTRDGLQRRLASVNGSGVSTDNPAADISEVLDNLETGHEVLEDVNDLAGLRFDGPFTSNLGNILTSVGGAFALGQIGAGIQNSDLSLLDRGVTNLGQISANLAGSQIFSHVANPQQVWVNFTGFNSRVTRFARFAASRGNAAVVVGGVAIKLTALNISLRQEAGMNQDAINDIYAWRAQTTEWQNQLSSLQADYDKHCK